MKTLLLVLGSTFFLGCMVVQFNDHDALLWVALYAFASMLGLLALFKKPVPIISFIASLGYGVYAAVLYSETRNQWFDGEVEREVAGMMLAAIWSALLARVPNRHETSSS
jgi:hypothetical protein